MPVDAPVDSAVYGGEARRLGVPIPGFYAHRLLLRLEPPATPVHGLKGIALEA